MTEDWRSQGVFSARAREYYSRARGTDVSRVEEPASMTISRVGSRSEDALGPTASVLTLIDGGLLENLDREFADFRSAAASAARDKAVHSIFGGDR